MEISLFTATLIKYLLNELQSQTLSRDIQKKCLFVIELLEKETSHVS